MEEFGFPNNGNNSPDPSIFEFFESGNPVQATANDNLLIATGQSWSISTFNQFLSAGDADTDKPGFYIFHGSNSDVVELWYDLNMTSTAGAVLIATFTNLDSPNFQNVFKGDTFIAVEAHDTNSLATVHLPLSNHVSGVVSGAGDAGPLAGVKVTLMRWTVRDGSASFLGLGDYTVTGPDGSFTISDVDPGSYTLFAEPPEDGTWDTAYLGDGSLPPGGAQAAGTFPQSRGSLLRHEKLIEFIHRNYEHDAQGQWFFQNGPQRVYVELQATPWIWRAGSCRRRSTSCSAWSRSSPRATRSWPTSSC